MEVEQDKLSHREEDILRLASEGFTDKEIASELGVQLSTVRTYWDRLKNKLGAVNRTEAVARSLKVLAAKGTPFESLEQFCDSFPHLLLVSNGSGVPEYTNGRWRKYVGDRQVLNWAEAVHPEDRNLLNLDGDHQVRCLRHDGIYRWHLVTKAGLNPSSDGVKRWVITAVDVHDFRRQH